jgi:hypothetical protein
MPEAHRVQVAEGFTGAVQRLVLQNTPAPADDLVEAVDVGVFQAHRQAQLVHAAGRTTGLQRTQRYRRVLRSVVGEGDRLAHGLL